MTKANKSVVNARREIGKHKTKFMSSSVSKKFIKAREKLLTCKGPKETEFNKLDIKWGKEKGGSLTGNEADKCQKSNIMDVCFQPKSYEK